MISLTVIVERAVCMEYAREVLSAGNSLAQRLSAIIGEFSEFGTFLRECSSIADLRHGGKLQQPDESLWVVGAESVAKPVPNHDVCLAEYISAALCTGTNRLCMFENLVARAGDPYLSRVGSRLRFLRDEVFHVAVVGDTDDSIVSTLKDAKSGPIVVGALSSVVGISPFQHREPGIIHELDLDEIVQNATQVLLGAYDGESYLVCDGRVATGSSTRN